MKRIYTDDTYDDLEETIRDEPPSRLRTLALTLLADVRRYERAAHLGLNSVQHVDDAARIADAMTGDT